MDLQRIKILAESRHKEFKGLAKAIGMSEGNLHRCVRENKIQAQDLEKIAAELNVSILEFFDKEETTIRQAGRDYVEGGKVELKGAEYNGPVTVGSEDDLARENADLRRKLIEAQDKIIKLMEDRK